MDKILKSPIIVLLLMSFCCVSGAFLDIVTNQATLIEGESLFAPIGFVVGIVVGFVILWRASQQSILSVLNQWFNPFSRKRREYTTVLTIVCPEDQVFNYCASVLHASNLRYELHHNLGTIIALQPSRTFFGIPNSYKSFGVDVTVRVEPLESGSSLVGISAESRRSIVGLWMASWAERWDYEAKVITEELFSVLLTILDRKGIEYGDYEVL